MIGTCLEPTLSDHVSLDLDLDDEKLKFKTTSDSHAVLKVWFKFASLSILSKMQH